MNPSFIGRRQQHARGSASISMNFLPQSENEKAGLLAFQNEEHFYFLCKSLEGNEPVVQLFKSCIETASDTIELLASQKISKEQSEKELYLKIEARGKTYAFFYSFKHAKWNLLKEGIDATWLSTRVAGGFVGSMYAMYATSSGKMSTNTSSFNWFEYVGNDKVYKAK
jgi:alpha-N-arabinofuranosidase